MIKATPLYLLVLALLTPAPSHGIESPFGIELKELERPSSAMTVKPVREKGRSEQRSRKRSGRTSDKQRERRGSDGYLRYTVQPGDHIFKILTGRMGMSNEAAEKLIPGIVRINRIRDIKNLTVGETLLIPNREQRAAIAKDEAVKVPVAAPAMESKDKAKPARGNVDVAPSPSPLPPPAGGGGAKTATATLPTASENPPSTGAASTAPPAATWICPVPERNPSVAIDSLLSLLEAAVSRGKKVTAGKEQDNSLSVEVDRYFEYKGKRYLVSIGEGDANRYTILRILETAGYKVLRLGESEDFRSAGEKLLTLVGVEPDFGRHALQQGKGISGFLIRPEGTMGRRVVVSAEQLGAGERWVLAPECGAR